MAGGECGGRGGGAGWLGCRRSGVIAVHVRGKPALGREDVGRRPVFGVVVQARVVDDQAAGFGEGVVRGCRLQQGQRGATVGDCDTLGGGCDAADGEDDGVYTEGFVLTGDGSNWTCWGKESDYQERDHVLEFGEVVCV